MQAGHPLFFPGRASEMSFLNGSQENESKRTTHSRQKEAEPRTLTPPAQATLRTVQSVRAWKINGHIRTIPSIFNHTVILPQKPPPAQPPRPVRAIRAASREMFRQSSALSWSSGLVVLTRHMLEHILVWSDKTFFVRLPASWQVNMHTDNQRRGGREGVTKGLEDF